MIYEKIGRCNINCEILKGVSLLPNKKRGTGLLPGSPSQSIMQKEKEVILYIPGSHPKTALLTDIFVMLKILSSGKRGTRLRDIIYMPAVKFFACLDLNQVSEDSEIASFRTETT